MTLQFQNLSIGYSSKAVQSGLTFEIAEHACLALIGPNGSGKSTLLKTCAGLLPALSGKILLDNTDIASYSPELLSRHISYVPQTISALPAFTVTEFVLQGLTEHRHHLPLAPSDAIRSQVLDILSTFHLENLADCPLQALSGGQRQLTMIASAIAQNADIILLDEPTSSLDPKNAVELFEKLHLVRQKFKRTFLIACHDINLITSIATHYLLLSPQCSPQFLSELPGTEEFEKIFSIPFKKHTVEEKNYFLPSPPACPTEDAENNKTSQPSKESEQNTAFTHRNKQLFKITSISLILLLITFVLCPFIGQTFISPEELSGGTDTVRTIFWQIRFPRVLLGGLAGAALALVGAAFQALLRNPLATPYTLGVANGSALGALLALQLGWHSVMGVSLASFLGAMLSTFFVLAIGKRLGLQNHANLLLAGIAWGLFTSAFGMLIQAFASPMTAQQMLRWQMGGLNIVGYDAFLTAPFLIPAMVLLGTQAWALNLISVDPELAQTRGIHVRRTHLIVFLAASFIVALIVSVTGPIAFVGLIIPHLVRKFTGPDNRPLFLNSILIGAAFLIIADTFARSLSSLGELPVGVITALIGAPALIAILFHSRNK